MTRITKLLCLVLMLALALGLWSLSPAHAAEVLNNGCTDEHSWGPWREEVVADCHTEGVLSRTCTLCGEVQRVTIPPFHNYDYQVTVVEPTCTEGGYIIHTCQCGASYDLSNGDALGHDLLSHEAQDPTCEEIGWQAYETCTRCDYSTYAEISATGHKYGYKHTDPTCTEPGYDIYICLNCGLKEAIETDEALGHDWSDWKVTEEFAEPVLQHRLCGRCGTEESRVMPRDHVCGGVCGEKLLWTLDAEGTLTVFGTGEMDQYWGRTPWYPLADSIKKVIVEEGVTRITYGAFNECYNLVSVQLADTVLTLDNQVFYKCYVLNSVDLGSGLIDLGSQAFYRCFKLRSLELPETFTGIPNRCFFNCDSLQQLTIPAAVFYIGERAFINCYSLETLIFQGDAPLFEDECFFECVLTAYYPADNETWTEEVRQNYGGTVTWVPICSEHNWSNWETVKPATCTLEGMEARVCGTCHYTEERTTPDTGHHWGQWTDSGKDQVRGCEICSVQEYIYSGPQMGHNIGDIRYPDGEYIDGMNYLFHRRRATTVKSNLKAENGGFTRVEYPGDILIIETYDADLNFLSGRGIPLELPIYGGVYLGEDYNFVVSGQSNPDENDLVEVVRITRYTKDWVRLDQASLYGANTTVPFDAGALRFARSGDMLYIHTSHEMYKTDDGVNHQANMSLCIHIPTMEITDSSYIVSYAGTGYVSHSFNQFVLVDGNDYITLDHGDANPRALVMHRSQGYAGASVLPFFKEEDHVLYIAKNLGHSNDTGVEVGGLTASSSHYIVVGSSVDQSVYCEQRYAHRNIFILFAPKDNFTEEATLGYWVTQYTAEDDVELSPPHIVEVEEDLFLLIWTENDSLRHCYITGQGELVSEIYENEGALSDCVPILDGNRVLWYTTGTLAGSNGYLIMKDDGLPVFYQIDLANPGKVGPAKCDHSYESAVTEPTCTEPGFTTHTCSICGHSYADSPTEARGHSWGAWQVTKAPTLEAPGEKHRVCDVCGQEEREVLPVLEFHYGDCNGDGMVNGKDLILLRQSLAGWDVELNKAAADCNGDGTVNGKDLILLRQHLAGWDVTLGPQE